LNLWSGARETCRARRAREISTLTICVSEDAGVCAPTLLCIVRNVPRYTRLFLRRVRACCSAIVAILILAGSAHGGPPYLTDDPEPTPHRHFEIYFFDGGTTTRFGTGSAAGVDFNYGIAPEFQTDVVVPAGFASPLRGPSQVSLGNIQLALKYRFLRQAEFGWDVAFYPRVFLPALSDTVGPRHAALFLPFWAQKDFGEWSTFGGGGYEINQGDGSKSFYQLGWAITRQVTHDLQLGVEVYHQSSNADGVPSTTAINPGFIYDLNDHFHLLGTIGPGIQNAKDTDDYSWYAAMLVTF
jgi:Putative MetA-pathway of phenol degradation